MVHSGNCGAILFNTLSVNSLTFGALSIDFSAASLFGALSISLMTVWSLSSLRNRLISSSLAAKETQEGYMSYLYSSREGRKRKMP